MSDDLDGSNPRFSDGVLARRCAAVRDMMARDELDALVVYSTAGGFAGVRYLADFRTAREAYLVLPAQGDPTLFVQYFNHVPYARRRARVADVRWAGSRICPPFLSICVTVASEQGALEWRARFHGSSMLGCGLACHRRRSLMRPSGFSACGSSRAGRN